MPDKTSETGIWIDDATGKVVKRAPSRGTQLVRPGGTITPYAQFRLDTLDTDSDAKPLSAAEALGNPVPVVEEVADPKPVTSPKKTIAAKKA